MHWMWPDGSYTPRTGLDADDIAIRNSPSKTAPSRIKPDAADSVDMSARTLRRRGVGAGPDAGHMNGMGSLLVRVLSDTLDRGSYAPGLGEFRCSRLQCHANQIHAVT